MAKSKISKSKVGRRLSAGGMTVGAGAGAGAGAGLGVVARATSATVMVMSVLFVLAHITLSAVFLNYLYRLDVDDCKCALGWRRTFMQAMLGLYLLLGIAALLGLSMQGHVWLMLLMLALSIAYTVVTRQFIMDIYYKDCACARTQVFRILDIVNIFAIVLLALTALRLLLLAVFLASMSRK